MLRETKLWAQSGLDTQLMIIYNLIANFPFIFDGSKIY